MLRSIDDLEGYGVRAVDGELGTVEDFYFDPARWTIRYAVIDTGRWLSGRKVLVIPSTMGPPDPDSKVLEVNLRREQIEKSPPIDLAKPISRQLQEAIHRYFGWPQYWLPPQQRDLTFPKGPSGERERSEEAKRGEEIPKLRSAKEVVGYDIDAVDGDIGHLKDMLVDGEWIIRHLVVDTGDILSGKEVLLSPAWISKISWANEEISVDLDSDAVASSPEYEPQTPLSRELESRIFRHFNRPVYW